MSNSYILRPAYLSLTSEQLLKAPVSAILAVSEQATKGLNILGIESIFDLGSSQLFGMARLILNAALTEDQTNPQKFSSDLVDDSMKGKSATEIVDSSVTVLRMIDDSTANKIQVILGISTIRELAVWPPYNISRTIITGAYGSTTMIQDDERPDELVPIMRQYIPATLGQVQAWV